VWAFDLLALDGKNLRKWSLERRQSRLQALLTRFSCPALLHSEPFDDGEALLRVAEKHGLEGVVSKRRDAPYKSGACRGWLKVKTMAQREAIASGGVCLRRQGSQERRQAPKLPGATGMLARTLPTAAVPTLSSQNQGQGRALHPLPRPRPAPFSGGEPVGPRRKRLPAFDALQEPEQHPGGLSAVRERQTVPGAGEHCDFRLRHQVDQGVDLRQRHEWAPIRHHCEQW